MCALYVTNTAALHHAIWSVVFFFVRLLRLFASQQDYPVYMEAYAKTTRPHCNDQPSHRYLCIVQWVGFFLHPSSGFVASSWQNEFFREICFGCEKRVTTTSECTRPTTTNSLLLLLLLLLLLFFPLFSHIIFSLPFLLRATFHFLRRISDLLSLITINVVRLTFFFVFLLCVKRWHI